MIKPISYAQILAEPHLIAEYSAECSIPEIGKTDPQKELYAAMENTGLMKSFGAYSGDELVGFGTVLTYVLPHYGKKVATVESIFLRKNDRNSPLGIMLMDEIEDYAHKSGCQAILYSAPTGSRFKGLLMRMKEYRESNSVFVREL